MSAVDELERSWRAGILFNYDFYFIETFSGHGRGMRDPKGGQYLLKPDASDHELGEAVLDALSKSRFVLPEEDMDLYSYELSLARYKVWIADLMARYGFKTKRALCKNMISCGADICGGRLKISPTRHEKLELWSREINDGIEDVFLRANSSAAEIGTALRLAFSRCT